MRDLYNRKQKLTHSILKAKSELDEPDRTHVLQFIEYIQEKDNSILWIVRCITALLYIRRQIDKPFIEWKKEDIKTLFVWMDTKNYKASTHEKFRKILKIFYKVVFGKNEFHPDCISWFSTQIGKEKKSQERDLDIAEYLEENEVPVLIEAAPTIQKKAFLACMYESGARPEEFPRLTNIDIKIINQYHSALEHTFVWVVEANDAHLVQSFFTTSYLSKINALKIVPLITYSDVIEHCKKL